MSSVGALIAAERKRRGWSQARLAGLLAKQAGRPTLTRHDVSRWERGERTPRFWLAYLAQVFDRDPAELQLAAYGDAPSHVVNTTRRLIPESPTHLDEILEHLYEHWHLLVRTDNLFGPRHAMAAVLDQISVIEMLLRSTRNGVRRELVSLAARYAESAAWLHEDAGDMTAAGYWTGRAMEWAHEADDEVMVAWTLFRRSQHAAGEHDAQRTIALARAAGRGGDRLPAPVRAAILQQEAVGHALDGAEEMTHHTLDEAHRWAAVDTIGDARGGHGSFCTETYLELQRAHCWLLLRQPRRAVATFDTALPELPAVYRRDRGVACSRFAHAYLAAGQPEQAAAAGRDALEIARSSGSMRTHNAVADVGRQLTAHRCLPTVDLFLHELHATA